MKRTIIGIITLLALSVVAHAQQDYLGAGVSVKTDSSASRTGPYIEAQAIAGENRLGTFTGHGLFFPSPAVRLGLDFAPRWDERYPRPFFGFGSEWEQTARRDVTHTTLTTGFAYRGLRLRSTRLFGSREGVRVGGDYLLPIKRSLAFHVAAEGTWNERGADYASLRFGFVRRF